MTARSVLISGAGIAGPTLAFWLNAAGFRTTIVERAPGLRAGGYVLDFWGLGYDIAERMGLASELKRVGYSMREMRIVDARGERITGFGTRVFRELTGGRFITLARSDLARLLFETVKGETEVLFGDEIVGLEERPDYVQAQFRHAGARPFDLVIGADGLHSNVRKLAFGPQQQFEKDLGYVVAAFETRGYRPRDEDVYVIYSEPRQMVARFALHDDRTLFLFVFTDEESSPTTPDLEAQKAMLRQRFGGRGWECAQILETTRSSAGPLFRSRRANQNGFLVARPSRARRGRGVLRLADGRPGLSPCNDRSLRVGGRARQSRGKARRSVQSLRGAPARVHRTPSRRAPSVSPPPLRRGPGLDCSCAIRW